MGREKGISRLAVLVAAAALLLIVPGSAQAATIAPNTTADEYDAIPDATCSLREAVQTADTNSNFGGCVASGGFGTDTVQLPTGTYMLTIDPTGGDLNDSGDLNTFSDMTIEASPGAAPTIDATGNGDRILFASVLGVTVT